MRKKIGKRIGPVPIAVVAVFALAAFISAGFWLMPSANQTAEAQGTYIEVTNPSTLTTMTRFSIDADEDAKRVEERDTLVLDVGQTVVINANVAFAAAGGGFSLTFPDDPDVEWDDQVTDDPTITFTNANGELAVSDIVAQNSAGGMTLGGTTNGTPVGASISRTATVTLTGVYTDIVASDGVTPPRNVDFRFNLTIVQNPIEQNGVMVENPDGDPGVADEKQVFPDGVCEVYMPNTALLQTRKQNPADPISVDNPRLSLAVLDILVSGGDCLSSDDSLDVSFTNAHPASGTDTTQTLLVYVTGGDDFNAVDPEVAEGGLDENILRVAGKSLNDNGKETITVSRSMADGSGIVYLIGYARNDSATLGQLDDDATTFRTNADFVVKAVFQDPPVEKDADDNVVSAITFLDAEDGVSRNAEDVKVMIKIRDANNHAVSGFVNLTVEGGSSVLFADSSLKTHRIRLDANGMAKDVVIEGLPKTGPFKIKLTAQIGELTLEEDIFREGDATTVEAIAYACNEDSDDDDEDVVGVCASEIAALKTKSTSDDPNEVVALGPDDSFVIGAKATDAADNTVSSLDELSWKITSSADNADDADDTLTTNRGDSLEEITVAGSDDAVPGTYSLTVTSADGEATTVIMITVSDVASEIMLTCDPEMVPTDTGQTDCVVMVTDANGNIPSNLDKRDDDEEDTIQVTVRSRDAQIIGVNDENLTDIDEEGMATFSILLREDAVEGSSITVNVGTSEIGDATLRTSATVTYGDPPTEPGMPMNVMAMATSYDMITVSWESPADDGGSDITGYMVQSAYMMADDMMSDWMDVDPAHMGMDKMYMDSGLMAETTYYYRVVAMNSDGMGEYSDGMAMAMTMMMPPMELGDPSITNVMSDADGMATVMLMPGDNATKHWAWAEPTDGSEGMWHGDSAFAGDATMVTFSGLTSGMNYWFIAIAGRGTGTDSEWSAWSGWTAEKSIQ